MISRSQRIRTEVLRSSFASTHGHIPTCFSVIECLCAVYEVMRHKPAEPDWSDRDIFILSKGHASLGHYGVLADFGYFDSSELATFGAFESRLGCHADRLKVPGVELSTGSLGHGIGVATGIALGIKINQTQRRVYTLIGDGESNEGSVWEAIMVAADRKLDNLTIILDYNKSQSRCLQIESPVEKFRSFGCRSVEVDGHDIGAIKAALMSPPEGNRPLVIVANTVKGFGSKTLTDKVFEWHRRSPDQQTLNTLLEEIDAAAI